MKNKKQKKLRTKRRNKKKAPALPPATTIVRREESIPLAPSGAPAVKETIQNMNKVRRSVVDCLNMDLKRALKRVEMKLQAPLRDWERAELEVDWGTIPGIDKPFLKQPGAEKVCMWLGLRPQFETTEHELPDGHLEVITAVKMFHKKTKELVFEGPACSCSTMESNFRFRFVMIEETETPPNQEEAKRLKQEGKGKWKKASRWIR